MVVVSLVVVAVGVTANLLGGDVNHSIGGGRFDDRATAGDWMLQSSGQTLQVLIVQSEWEDLQGRLMLGDTTTADAVLGRLLDAVDQTRESLRGEDLQAQDAESRSQMLYGLSLVDTGAQRQRQALDAGDLPQAVAQGDIVAEGFNVLLANVNSPRP